jgi:DNA-binding transcriptional LysR family regulator
VIRYPLARVRLHLSNRRVDLINERYDIAFRIRSNFETDQSLTLRNLGSSHLVLVAEPSLFGWTDHPHATASCRSSARSVPANPLHDGRSDHQRDQPAS